MEIEGWFRKLEPDADGERLEIFLRVGIRKVRASGPADEMHELVDWFEQKTGLRVESGSVKWRRVRVGPRPMAGQITLDDAGQPPARGPDVSDYPDSLYDELSSDATGMVRVEHDGGVDLFDC